MMVLLSVVVSFSEDTGSHKEPKEGWWFVRYLKRRLWLTLRRLVKTMTSIVV